MYFYEQILDLLQQEINLCHKLHKSPISDFWVREAACSTIEAAFLAVSVRVNISHVSTVYQSRTRASIVERFVVCIWENVRRDMPALVSSAMLDVARWSFADARRVKRSMCKIAQSASRDFIKF